LSFKSLQMLSLRGAAPARGACPVVRFNGRWETFMKALKLTALLAASLLMMAASAGTRAPGGSDLTKGLMGLWHLDGAARDSSGTGHYGTVVGATVVAGGVSGGSAYAFDGAARIDVGNLDFSGERFT